MNYPRTRRVINDMGRDGPGSRAKELCTYATVGPQTDSHHTHCTRCHLVHCPWLNTPTHSYSHTRLLRDGYNGWPVCARVQIP